MFIHPYIGSQLARERQREMQAQADKHRARGNPHPPIVHVCRR